MNDFVVSHIRTLTPIAIAWFFGWLLTHGVQIDPNTGTALATGIGAILAGIYYAVVREAEKHWPIVGVLLGIPSVPTYPDPVVPAKKAGDYQGGVVDE